MLPHAVAVAADVNHVAVMHEPVDEGSSHDLVAQDRAPCNPLVFPDHLEVEGYRDFAIK